MAITISCANGSNTFSCCSGSSSDHDFQGVMLNDGTNTQRIYNPVQISKGTNSVLVWDNVGNWRNVLVADVAAATDVDALAQLITACRSTTSTNNDYLIDDTNSPISDDTGNIITT